MLNNEAKLDENFFDKPSMGATRDGFGSGIVEAGRIDSRIVALSADLDESTKCESFHKEYPDRFVDVGVAEQNLVTCASGMAAVGKIPFAAAYAAFSPGRNWEQIKTTICLNDLPVIVCGHHAGLLTGPDGATHQALEDIAMMRVLPNMTVISPCDRIEAHKATLAAARFGKPVYLRFAREKMPTITTKDTSFEIGKAIVLWKPKNPSVAIFSTGPITVNVLHAAKKLSSVGVDVSVTNIHTIKPLDVETIIHESQDAGKVVTVEEHQIIGGLGSAVAEVLSQKLPMPMKMIGINDVYGQSGEGKELWQKYGLSADDITKSILEFAQK